MKFELEKMKLSVQMSRLMCEKQWYPPVSQEETMVSRWVCF